MCSSDRLQRISGFGIAGFLFMHVGWTRILSIWNDAIAKDMYSHMQNLLTNPVTLVLYAVGLFLAVLHLANGLFTFGITWGITTTPKAQKISMGITGCIGLVLLFFGYHGLLGFFLEPSDNPATKYIPTAVETR